MKFRNLAICMVAMILPLGLAACSGSGATSAVSSAADLEGVPGETAGDLQVVNLLPPPPETNNGQDELIAENDLLENDVFQVDELDRTVRVDSNGRISLSLIGQVDAKGKTIPQLEAEIESRYRRNYLQNPEVSVFMKESAGQRVTVDGAVIKPGIYPVASTSTLLQVVALAGGFQEIADEQKLYVFRQVGPRKLVANYSVKDIREGKKRDPRIFGGDVIPGRANRKRTIRYDETRYKSRHLIENAFCRLKDFRRVATRYDKLARNFLSAVALATLVAFWL